MACIDPRYMGCVCELRGREERLLATGSVAQIGDTFIKINNTINVHSTAQKGMTVHINVTHPELGIIALKGIVYIAVQGFAIVNDVQRMATGERRVFYRLSVDLSTTLRKEELSCSIKISNISLGGLMFTSREQFQMQDRVLIDLRLLTKPTSFDCIIKRVAQYHPPILRYGCSFCENDQKKTDMLCRYMFQMEGRRVR